VSESERRHKPERDGARDSAHGREHLAAWVDEHLEAYLDGELTAEETGRVDAFVRQDEAAARRLALAGRVRALLSAADRPACPPDVTRAVLDAARTDAMAEAGMQAGRSGDAPARTSAERTHAPAAGPDRPAVPAAHPLRGRLTVPFRAAGRTAGAPKWAPRWLTSRATSWPSYWTTYVRPALTTAALVLLVVAAALVGGSPRDAARVAEHAPDPASMRAPEATPAEVDRALQEARWALAYVSNVGRRAGRSIRQEVLEERVSEPVQRAIETGLDTALGGEPSS